MWSGDGIAQHYPALVQVHQDFQNLLFHGKPLAMWQWKVGLGQDYLQTFSYYVLGDPFFYPSILVPEAWLPDYYSIMVIVRLYLAGLAFVFAAKRLIKVRNVPIALGAIVYIFSGYSAYSVFSHPFFVNPLIIFPLLIIAVQKAVQNKSIFPLIVMVAVTLLVNFYFAYILAVGAIVYWLIELVRHREYRQWKIFLRTFLAALTGFLISACLFIPSLYFLVNSARTAGNVANGIHIYPLAYYLSLPATMLVPRVSTGFWFRGGFMSLGLLGVIYIGRNYRKYRTLTATFGIGVICMLVPFLCGVLNGMSSPSNRWLLLLQLPLGLSAAFLLDHVSELTKKDFQCLMIAGGVIAVSLLLTLDTEHWFRDLTILAFGYFLTAIILFIFRKSERKITAITSILVIFNAAAIFLSVEPYGKNRTNNLMSKSEVLSLVKRQRGYQNADDQRDFSRTYIDTQLPGYTYHPSLPILSSLNSFETYWSLEGDNVYQFMHDLGVSNSIPNDVTGNGDLRDVLFNYLGVDKLWLNESQTIVPNSYQKDENRDYNNQKFYHSDSAFPLFYFPKYVMSSKTYQALSPTQKEASLLDSVEVAGGKEESSMAKKVRVVPFDNFKGFTTKTPTQLENQSPYAQVVLPFDADKSLEDKEIHLEFSNIDYQTFKFGELWNTAIKDHETDDTYKYRWLVTNYLKIGRIKPGYIMSASYLDRTNSFKQLSPKRLSGYELRDKVALNLGPAENTDKDQKILLNVDTLAHYSFDLKAVAGPSSKEIKKSTQEIKRNSQENIKFDLERDQIKVNVKNPVKKVIASTVPYSKGWRINHGKIVKVNGAFIGIELEKGQKDYKLTYRTPGLLLGLIMSAVGLIIALAWWGIKLKTSDSYVN
ncbi:hypothetical protein XA3_01640 [Xylocopilactobacillus apicola]|uniref:YfhO family protein n=1 Tax=Xylocopilactobacillus apicola TaxID=2932184 RepID=A0AAU9DV37_9LACO|nr:hypothetical protein XA3_01640 [Xylocopilactobacillus apicola]